MELAKRARCIVFLSLGVVVKKAFAEAAANG
jgi:hypothetical protein